ncbi:MAG: MerC domain-containing protein [Cellvibrionales bacterium]|nr:MerC domain-containing protein [Cellvibrionales bacterium]
MRTATAAFLDRFSIGASVVCALHCAAMPMLLALYPALSALVGDDHFFHLMLVWLVLPCSLLAGFFGCGRHKDRWVLAGIGAGLGLLVGTALVGHDMLGELGEKTATVMASCMLVAAHWRNYCLCRKHSCDHRT